MPNFSALADVIESLCICLGDALVLEKGFHPSLDATSGCYMYHCSPYDDTRVHVRLCLGG
jgi:hypothetical protein